MQLTIQTTSGEKSNIDVPEGASVTELKNTIKEALGHEPIAQKLVYTGRILEDDKSLADYGIKEGDKLVIMIDASKIPQPEVPENFEAQGSSNLVLGDEYDMMVQNIVDMGFAPEQVEEAMNAAYNNPDRAIDYLMNGIPEDLLPDPAEVDEEGDPLPGEGEEGDDIPPRSSGPNPLAYLESNPSFQQIRSMIQQNPDTLQSLLQQLETQNPELLALIQANSDAFMDMIENPPSGEGVQIDPNLVAGLNMPGMEPAEPESTIQLTEEEEQSVMNLASLGFDPNDALEAYLTCDKDEAIAANLLFENYQPINAMFEDVPPSQPPEDPTN